MALQTKKYMYASLLAALAATGWLISIAEHQLATVRHIQTAWVSWRVREPAYKVQVFSTDPVILHIRDFLSRDEINHVLRSVEGRYETSRVWSYSPEGHIDKDVRVSESAVVPNDAISRRIAQRARHLMGWRNNDTVLQPFKSQRYPVNGFYSFHFDWTNFDELYPGNRVTTLMVYLETDASGGGGGGTNFPRLPQPADPRWCDVIACPGDVEHADYPGVTFKPLIGSAVFWENMHANGTPHRGTRHAGLPVRSGHKTGLNIWSWDQSWRPPAVDNVTD